MNAEDSMRLEEEKDQEYSELINSNIDDIEIGELADNFLRNTAIGRYLIKCAAEQEEAAFKEFLTVDPKDAIAIQEVQHRGSTPKLVIAFLADAINRGNAASEILAAELEGMNDGN